MNLYFILLSAYVIFLFRSFLELVEMRAGSQKEPSENQSSSGWWKCGITEGL